MSNLKWLDQHLRVFTNHICITGTVFPSISAKYWLACQPRLATAHSISELLSSIKTTLALCPPPPPSTEAATRLDANNHLDNSPILFQSPPHCYNAPHSLLQKRVFGSAHKSQLPWDPGPMKALVPGPTASWAAWGAGAFYPGC